MRERDEDRGLPSWSNGGGIGGGGDAGDDLNGRLVIIADLATVSGVLEELSRRPLLPLLPHVVRPEVKATEKEDMIAEEAERKKKISFPFVSITVTFDADVDGRKKK